MAKEKSGNGNKKDKIVDEEGKREPIKYTLIKEFATLSANETRKKVVTIGKWGDNPPKVDIRVWKLAKDTGLWHPTKGISLTYEEMAELKGISEEVTDEIAEVEEGAQKKSKNKKDK